MNLMMCSILVALREKEYTPNELYVEMLMQYKNDNEKFDSEIFCDAIKKLIRTHLI